MSSSRLRRAVATPTGMAAALVIAAMLVLGAAVLVLNLLVDLLLSALDPRSTLRES